MPSSIRIGPLALPPSLLLLVLAAALALLAGKRIARRTGAAVEGPLHRILLVGLVVARLAFVLQYRHAYLADPWSILDIRDGGWEPQAGLLGAWFYASLLARRLPALRRPVLSALAVASATWIGGTIAIALSVPEQRPLPEFTAVSIDGESVRLPDYAGRPAVINLWASWCPPCRREMPVLERAQKARPEVEFVFLNQGETADTVRRFLDRNGLSLRNVLLDSRGEFARLFQLSALPATLFFDADGRLASVRIGELSDATIEHHVGPLVRREASARK